MIRSLGPGPIMTAVAHTGNVGAGKMLLAQGQASPCTQFSKPISCIVQLVIVFLIRR